MEISIQKSRKSPGRIDERWRMIEDRSCCEKERDTVEREEYVRWADSEEERGRVRKGKRVREEGRKTALSVGNSTTPFIRMIRQACHTNT